MLKKAKITLLLIFFIPFPGRFLLFADDALFLYKDGQKARYEQNYGRAIEKFRASLEKNPHYFLPMIALSECFLKTGEYDEALKYVKLAQKYDKNNVDLYSLEGRIEIGLGSLDKAREAFNRVLAIQPNNLNARFGMAELDIAVGQKRTAAKRYIETLTLSPESQRALLSLSLIYEDLGEEKVSQSYLELALKYHSSNPDVQMVILGTGEKWIEEKLRRLDKKLPNLKVFLEFDNSLAHLIEAGSDFFLMPSKYEPCGLNQVYSLKYGAIPIVRATGGLKDTVSNFFHDKKNGTGFHIPKMSAESIVSTVSAAMEIWRNKKESIDGIRHRGMAMEFLWSKYAAEYETLYTKCLNHDLPD